MSENFIKELFSKLNLGGKSSVYVSVTPGLGIEMVQVDYVNHLVKSYTSRPLSYNDSLREVASMEEFKAALTSMFEELGINPRCNVTLNLPMVLFGSIELPLFIGDEGITGGVTNEVEQSYIFKRHDPIVSWMDASGNASNEKRKIIYSAVQQLVIDNIKAALGELGATLVSLDMSLASTLRALSFTGLADAQMQEGITWNLLMVSATGYSLVSMVGKNIIDYYEEPLAIKSFEGDEIYNAINSSAQITLMSYPANYLLVVSETDAVSAELLSKKLNVEYSVSYLENNHYKRKEFLPASLDVLPDNVMKVSLQAIGVAISQVFDYPIAFNFLSSSSGVSMASEEAVKFKLGEKEIELTPSGGLNLAILFSVLLIIPFLAAFLLLPMAQTKKQAQLDELKASIDQVQKQVSDLEQAQSKAGTFDIKTEIQAVMRYNRAKLMTYSAIGTSVPSKLWLTYFMTQADGQVDIKGVSTSVEDVYLFFRNLKESLIGNQLKLHKLEMQSGSVEDVVSSSSESRYEFEITNMTNSQLNPQAAPDPNAPVDPNAPPATAGGAQPAPQADAGAPSNSLLGDQPLPNIGK